MRRRRPGSRGVVGVHGLGAGGLALAGVVEVERVGHVAVVVPVAELGDVRPVLLLLLLQIHKNPSVTAAIVPLVPLAFRFIATGVIRLLNSCRRLLLVSYSGTSKRHLSFKPNKPSNIVLACMCRFLHVALCMKNIRIN